jgi:hypothetical protein
MRNFLAMLKDNPVLMKRLAFLVMMVSVGIGSFFWGRSKAGGNPPPNNPGAKTDDAKQRIVAYVYNNMPITREEFGEYLVDRLGAERLDFMINRKIVELECKKHNIFATDSEVEERFLKDIDSFGSGPTKLTKVEFVNGILKRFGKTEYEWREDVIRPKIMMEKLVQASVKISEADVREGFEARYGPKVDCRMIVIDKGNLRVAQQVWEAARKGRTEFLVEAKKQFIPNLAMTEGKVPAIHRHFGDKQLEDVAFRLKEGEISGLLEMSDKTYVILMCERHLPADTNARFEQERQKLAKEMYEMRVAQRIPEAFAELRKSANPRLMLVNPVQTANHVTPPPVSQPQTPKTIDPPAVPSLPPVELPKFEPRPITVPNGTAPKISDTPPPAPVGIAPPVEAKKN